MNWTGCYGFYNLLPFFRQSFLKLFLYVLHMSHIKFKTNITTVLFSNDYEYLYRRENVKGIQKLTDKEYFVGGCTALYDALGNSIHDI